jgi:tetratricopeptide (TPR) repeat protein
MEMNGPFPQRHPNHTQESVSEKYFRNCLPRDWVVDKPTDYGIDLIVYPVISGNVTGLKFVVQLKSKLDTGEKLTIRLKKSTLNYLFNGSDPAMVVLYDDATEQAYWKWLLPVDFDLTEEQDTFAVRFDEGQNLAAINWKEICIYVQRVFKVKNRLLTSLEYDLFNTVAEVEGKAWSHFVYRNFAEAALYFKRLIEHDQIKVEWLVALARCQFEEYDYRSALITINKAYERDTAGDIFLTKGTILAEDGIRNKEKRKIIDANKIFEKLFQQNPSEANAYNYANTLSRLDKQQEAIAMYRHALGLNPNSAEAWKNLGQVYYDLKDHVREMECYDKALLIDPTLLQARVCRAITKGFVYEEYEPSITDILECLAESDRVAAEFPTAYYYLGLFLWRLGRTTEAFTWVTKGLDNRPGHPWLLRLKGSILWKAISGDDSAQWIDEAAVFFSDNHEVHPGDGVNFYYLCIVVARGGDKSKAQQMALDWLNECIFSGLTPMVNAAELDIDQALLILKQYQIVQSFLSKQPLEKIARELDNASIDGNEHLLRLFNFKRIIFLAQVTELFSNSKAVSALADELLKLFQTNFFEIDGNIIGPLIKTRKDEWEEFLVEATHVVSLLGGICSRETVRGIGHVVNYLHLEEPVGLDKDEFFVQLYAEAETFFMDEVEQYFGLTIK